MNVNHQRKVAELVDSFSAILKIECEKLYRSNMVEVESFSPDEYILAKILVSAAIERATTQETRNRSKKLKIWF